MEQFIHAFLSVGSTKNETDDERLFRIVGLLISFSGILTVLFLALFYWFYEASLAASIEFVYALLITVLLFLFSQQKIDLYQWLFANRIMVLVVPFFATWSLGGLINSGFVALWSSLSALSASVTTSARQTLMFLATFLSLLVFTTWEYFRTPDVSFFPEEIIYIMTIINVAGPIIIYVLAIAYFGREKNKFQAQADNLLLNILPVNIAKTLKQGSHFIAQRHPKASVLFADIVDFTPMSSKLTPKELVELLNHVFSYFDLLTEKYQMEKIKTIGDCYMVAAGVPLERVDHALAITQMAVEMQDYVNTHTFLGRRLSFRIGINSGEMISGVIGKKKFAYDLWGDTVNTASRMESHGEEGCIQITRATYELIKDDFICEPKGFINIKGKGEMEIWHVLSSKPSQNDTSQTNFESGLG